MVAYLNKRDFKEMGISSSASFPESNKELSYPKLMVSGQGCIVLMTSYGEGTCLVKGNTENTIGHHDTRWSMTHFKDFYGNVILENLQ